MARSTLIILAILFTVVAFVAADLDFWRTHGLAGRVHYHSNTLLTSFAIASRGEIELDEDRGAIAAIAPGAVLEIRERRLTTRRRLEVRGDSSGRPIYHYEVGSRELPEAAAKRYLATHIDEILSTTTIGAEARVQRLVREEGVEGVLEEVGRLETNSLRRIYLVEAARAPDLDRELAVRLVRTAAQTIASSSQLGKTLVEMAEALPTEWTLTGELAGATEGIASSSERASTLERVVRQRSLEPADVDALRRAVTSIASSSEKGRLVRRLVEIEPQPWLVDGMLEAARSIESSTELRRVLSALVAVPELSDELFLEALDVSEEIASSRERAGFLQNLVAVLPSSAELASRYIEVASTISSSVEKRSALATLLEDRALSPGVCVEWVRSASQVASSEVQADLLVAAARRCAASSEVLPVYLTAVEELPSSVDQRRALVAMAEVAAADAAARAAIADVAERAVASASERALVLERLATAAQP